MNLNIKHLILILILLLHPYKIQAYELTKTDWLLELTAITLITIDWGQSRDMAKKIEEGEKIHETNPLLSKKPTLQEIDTMIPLAILAQFLIAQSISKNPRTIFLLTVITFELDAVISNHRNGLRINISTHF